MRAKDIMTPNVITVGPGHSVRHAAQIMLDGGIGGLPVVDDDRNLIGILTDGDLLRRFELGVPSRETTSAKEQARAYVKTHSWNVADVMTTGVITVGEDTPVGRIAVLMDEHGIKRLPVMRGDFLVGIVSRTDLLRAILKTKPDETASGDQAIRRSILARLRESTGLQEERVDVTVECGMVYLSGAVGSQDARQAARVVAEGVRGVAGVVDQLQLMPELHGRTGEDGHALRARR